MSIGEKPVQKSLSVQETFLEPVIADGSEGLAEAAVKLIKRAIESAGGDALAYWQSADKADFAAIDRARGELRFADAAYVPDYSLLEELRVFCPKNETKIWRISQGFGARTIEDSSLAPDKAGCMVDERKVKLWGTYAERNLGPNGGFWLCENRGMRIWLPPFSPAIEWKDGYTKGQGGINVFLTERRYLGERRDQDDAIGTGWLDCRDMRLVEIEIKK